MPDKQLDYHQLERLIESYWRSPSLSYEERIKMEVLEEVLDCFE